MCRLRSTPACPRYGRGRSISLSVAPLQLFDHSSVLTGTPEDFFAAGVAATFISLFHAFSARGGRKRRNGYDVRLAWLRAGMYFCACFLASWATGVLHTLLHAPLFSAAQAQSTSWLALTAGCVLVEIVGYWVIWPMGTFTLDRERHVPVQVTFGFVWGLAEAQVFLAFWAVVEMFGMSTLATALVAFFVISTFQGMWHSLYWDIHVAPEHNIPAWNKWKVLCVHVPNLIITLTYLSLHGSAALFVSFQTLSLVSSTIYMRFPPFWSDQGRGDSARPPSDRSRET